MLEVTIPARPATDPIEFYDEATQEFVTVPGLPAVKEQVLRLEHSLVSLSKWESKWCKPFFSKTNLTDEESIDYIRCMTLTQNVPSEVYNAIPNNIMEEIAQYINAPMTATWFSDNKKKGRSSSEVVTSELIYYWMIALNIPPDYQKWHLNRLMTLIQVCNIKNTPPKKMSRREITSRNAALNAARRKQFNSNG
jgi:hypothetical protein